ncbi:MAG: phosphate acyltransferase PlsX [Lentisphaeria bacterium]
MKIALDVMGGDYAPNSIMDGLALAYDRYPGVEYVLVGDESKVRSELNRIGLKEGKDLSICHASQVVEMSESSTVALRLKKDSSITVSADLMKNKEVDAVVSAGHTGAAVASHVVKVRTLPGIERPGIATVFPTPQGKFVLLDAGANVDSKPIHLVQFAIMGEIYAREILSIKNPRIGILSNGEEEGKGNELSKATLKILTELPNINFIGNVEGHDLFEGHVDVVVCDGFVGNVVLKTCESIAKSITSTLKGLLQKNFVRQLGAGLSMGAFKEFKKIVDYAEYGGAPLMGINGTCIISHGSSSDKAIMNAIRVATEFVHHDVNRLIVDRWNELEPVVMEAINS